MEEKLEELLQEAESHIIDLEEEIKSLRYRLSFFSQHGFQEELRHLKNILDAKTPIYSQFKTDIEKIRELLDKWTS